MRVACAALNVKIEREEFQHLCAGGKAFSKMHKRDASVLLSWVHNLSAWERNHRVQWHARPYLWSPAPLLAFYRKNIKLLYPLKNIFFLLLQIYKSVIGVKFKY